MKKTDVTNNEGEKRKISRGLIAFIAIFLSAVIIFGIVFGAIAAVRHKNAVVIYEGITMDKEVVSFFASYYKTQYMNALISTGVEVADNEWFWNSKYEEGKTYGDALTDGINSYIKNVIVASHLFDSYTELTDEGDEFIDKCVNEILEYKGGGNKASFNASVKKYGFSFDSFKKAAKLLYKAQNAQALIYGTKGENITKRADACSEFLSTYSHVKLLFIRTEEDFLLDEEGNRVSGEGGDVMRPLTEGERIERQTAINDIRESITAYENGTEGQISPEYFGTMLTKYDSASEARHAYGYYLHESSTYTSGFAKEISEEVAKKALSMEIDSYGEVKLDYGVCFIYKYTPDNNAYLTSGLDIFFEDFYINGAAYFFNKDISVLAGDVTIKENYYEIDFLSLPYNTIYIPRF